MKGYFKPEFLNRFDGVIVFKPLSMTHVVEIAKLMVDEFKNKLKKCGYRLGNGQAAEKIIEVLSFSVSGDFVFDNIKNLV